jgi:hypothetical protein
MIPYQKLILTLKEKAQIMITAQEKRKQVASHEAGPAVMAYLRRMKVTKTVVDFEHEKIPG